MSAARWLWYSSVPGMAVPGMACPGMAGTGAYPLWIYIGHIAVYYLDYLDSTTTRTLAASPGLWYSMFPVNSRAGLTIPPPDNCWLTTANLWADRVVLARPLPPDPPPPAGVLALDALHGTRDALGRARVRNVSLQAFRARQPARPQPAGSPRYARIPDPGPPSQGALMLAAARARNAELQAAARVRGLPLALEIFGNVALAVVSSGGTDAPASGTTETWTVQGLGNFPAVSSPATQLHVADVSQNTEIIAVTNMSGAGNLTWAVTRGAEGTVPVAHSAGFVIYQVTTAGFLNSVLTGVLSPSGDATGATDTANINAAIAAIGSSCGQILLSAGTFYWTCGSVAVTSPGVYIYGAGRWATIISAVGTGDTFRAYTTANYAGSGGGPAGGCLKGLTFDGTSAGAGSSGAHIGDLYNYDVDFGSRHFQGTGSKAIWFDNQYTLNGMEQMTGRVWAETSTTHVQFDVNPASTYAPSGSFDRTNMDIFVDGKGKGNLVVLNNGAFIVDGDLGIYGNTDYGASTYYVLTLTGPSGFSFTATNASPCVFTAAGSAYYNGLLVNLSGGSLPAGFTAGTAYYVVNASGSAFELAATSGGTAINSTSTGSGTVQSLQYSAISNSVLRIGVECNGTTGTQPGTISFGATGPSGNFIEGCGGLLDFSAASSFAHASNAGENFQFDGPVFGDTFLQRVIGLGQQVYQFGALSNSQTVTTRYNSVTRVEPASNVTGIALSGFDPLSGQVFWLVNDSAFTITFAAKSTSKVMGGTAVTVQANSAMQFIWNDSEAAWFPAGNSGQPAATAAGGSPAGCIAQTMPWWFVSGSGITAASGTLYLHAVTLPAGIQVSNLTFAIGSTSGATLTHGWYVLLTSAWLQVAHTADQTSGGLTAGTAVTKALVTPYTPATTGPYYIGYMVVAGTQPAFCGAGSTQGGSMFAEYPSNGASSTGLTTPGTDGTTTYAAITAAGDPVYGYCS